VAILVKDGFMTQAQTEFAGGSNVGGAASPPRIETLGELRATGYEYRTVKSEMRRNLLGKLSRREPIFFGIVGYEDTVLPQLVQAILSKHDILLLGLRGQAKTKILRQLPSLFDAWIPALGGVEIADDPVHPTTGAGKALVAEQGDGAPIRWIHRSERYHEKLATPDVTIADLIGEIDIVKHAEGRYLSDEATMHFGLIPRSNRGMFVINELPDLAPRIQVGLFNVLEERDIQVRGYPIRLALDLCLAFSANPEDYTNRGRIVTPLKDRIGSVIRTHYPLTNEDARDITNENAFAVRDDSAVRVIVPTVMHDILEETIRQARTSNHVNQSSGVSARASMAALENVVSSAERRGVVTGEPSVMVRMCDLSRMLSACRGKIELMLSEEGAIEDGRSTEDRLIEAFIGEAVKVVLERFVRLHEIEDIADEFTGGISLEITDLSRASEVVASMGFVEGLADAAEILVRAMNMDVADEQAHAVAGELILELLYVNKRISKVSRVGTTTYRR